MTDYGGVVGNGKGAWQVGFRTSKYTSDQAVSTSTCTTTGKCESSVNTGTTTFGSRVQNSETARTNTYALNWVLNSNARVMFNYAETKFGHNIVLLDTNGTTSAYTGGATDNERVLSVRTQIHF
jgi:hypothetical protein